MKSWLTIACGTGRLEYYDTKIFGKSLISQRPRPITPRLPTPPIPRRIREETAHGRTFPVQEHHAPQGPAGRPEIESVRQAGARNHGGGEIGDAGPGNESTAPRRHDRRASGEHAEGQYRARHQESDRRRGRELRRDSL